MLNGLHCLFEATQDPSESFAAMSHFHLFQLGMERVIFLRVISRFFHEIATLVNAFQTLVNGCFRARGDRHVHSLGVAKDPDSGNAPVCKDLALSKKMKYNIAACHHDHKKISFPNNNPYLGTCEP